MNGYMETVKYEIYKDGKLVLSNFDYFESRESAKKALEERWRKCTVVIK
jgi:hypothetical protein